MAEAETYFQSPEATTVTKPVNDEFSHGKAYFDDDIKSQPKGRGDMTPTPAFSNDERASARESLIYTKIEPRATFDINALNDHHDASI